MAGSPFTASRKGVAMFGFFGAPGELLIILAGLLCIGGFAGIAAIVIVLMLRKPSGTPNNPNVFACPDCAHLVSRQAKACPNCGRPF